MNTLSITSTKTMTYNEGEALRAHAIVEKVIGPIVVLLRRIRVFAGTLCGPGGAAPRKAQA